MGNYEQFIKSKVVKLVDAGFQTVIPFNNNLFDFQVDIVDWCLQRGRSAIFADCGLGKTLMQLEWANHVHQYTGKPVLILAPLAVASQTQQEGVKFGIDVKVCESSDDVVNGINITNYQKLAKFNTTDFSGIVLDESSIIKSFMGKIKQQIEACFLHTPYKLFCTATPAPNDHMELGNHAQLLGVMPSNEMLARWFINDTSCFGNYRVKKHAVADFWQWVSSWACCISNPADLGYNQQSFELPELIEHNVIIETDLQNHEKGLLFDVESLSATNLHKQLRKTATIRAEKTADLIGWSDEPWLIWCNTNYEADALKKAIPGAVEVRGSDKNEVKEKRLLGFSNGDFKVLITKSKIAGFGMNWQHCCNVVFTGLSYSYESYYQALRRCWRFGQENTVNSYIVLADKEKGILQNVNRKKEGHIEMGNNMLTLTTFANTERRTLKMGYNHITESGKNFTIHNGDSCDIIKTVDDNSIDFSIYSPPFSSLYIYSDSIRDMGNCKDDQEFFEHYSYLVKELFKKTRPGRLSAVHCKNLVYYKGQRGTAGLRDFRGEIIKTHIDAGWDYHSEITIWKDPVTEMQRTKAHGLLHRQTCRDTTFSRQGLPDYLVIFRKWAKDEESQEMVNPVNVDQDQVRFQHYRGVDGPTDWRDARDASIQVWQRYASPVWMDINQTDVLNKIEARAGKDEKHICPLQLGVISRAIHLWTNEGDTVFTPFLGIGSELYESLKLNRKGIGVELKPEYFRKALKNLLSIENAPVQLGLFGD